MKFESFLWLLDSLSCVIVVLLDLWNILTQQTNLRLLHVRQIISFYYFISYYLDLSIGRLQQKNNKYKNML